MKRLLVAVVAALAALAVAAPASAHSVFVNGTSVCEENGTYSITWTIENDWPTTMTFTSTRDGVSGTVPGATNSGNGAADFRTRLPGAPRASR